MAPYDWTTAAQANVCGQSQSAWPAKQRACLQAKTADVNRFAGRAQPKAEAMSALGHWATRTHVQPMSALPSIADMIRTSGNVRFAP